MNLGSISDKLPTYPSNIQGELRLILQTKDIFMVCYKQLEEYRRLINEQNRLITKEFVQEQLQVGEDEIAELKMELSEAESKLAARLRHNELLADQLSSQGFASLEGGGSVRHMALARSPNMRKQMLAQRKNNDTACARAPTHMIDNIALAIDEIHQEVRTKVKPLLDYYRDLFYLQLHFSLILGQVCNYCMPLVTENIGLLERVFFWAERPEFELIRKASDISDRLKEIYTRTQQIFGILSESVRFLQSKVELQKSLETRFHERMDEQQKIKDKVLREIHASKQNMDMLEEENDRLVGSLVKLDPTFVESQNFVELAEGGHMPTKPGTGSHNLRQPDDYSSSSPIEEPTTKEETHTDTSNMNARFDYNNNKAFSVMDNSDESCANSLAVKKQSKPKYATDNAIGPEKSSKPKKKKMSPEKDDTKSPTEEESNVRLRGRKRDSARQKKMKRASTAVAKERAASSGTEARESGIRRRSSSRVRSPSLPATSQKRSRSQRTYSPDSEVQTKEKSKVKGESKKAPDSPSQHVNGGTLKSRLLDRTKGLIESTKGRSGKLYRKTSSESGASSVIAHAYQQPREPEGEAAVTSISSFDSTYAPEVSETGKDKWQEVVGKKSKSKATNRKGKKASDELKIPAFEDQMLVFNEIKNKNNSNRRRSKSRHGNRNQPKNDLADFLTSSASECLSSEEGSLLPVL